MNFRQRLEAARETLSPSGLRVAEYLASRPDRAAVASAVEIAEATGTSDATVVRTVRQLGYIGLPDLRQQVGAEWAAQTNPRAALQERLALAGATQRSLLDALVDDAIKILEETRRQCSLPVMEAATKAVADAGAITVFGVGRAGPLAAYLALGLTRIGKRAHASTHSGFLLADDLAQLDRNDVLILVAPLRHLHEVDVAIARARAVGATTVLVTETLAVRLGDQVDFVLQTGSSNHRLANEGMAPLILLDTLLLGVSALQPEDSFGSWTVINELRGELVGPAMDVPLTIQPNQ